MKLLPLPKAFRVILRDGYPPRPALADEIQSRHWFMYVTDKPTEEVTAAKFASNVIYSAIRDQRLRLKGCLGRDEPADIDPIEITRGRLDVLDGTLKVYDGAATLRTYTHLHCYEDEISDLLGGSTAEHATDQPPAAQIDAAQAEKPTKYRWATDAANVPAAVAAIMQGTFTSAHQAAGHFANSSEPGRSYEQNKERLRKLISVALPKTAKDRQS
jgi:hypothetical protein